MNMFSEKENIKKDKLTIPNTPIEMEDSIYYNVLYDMIINK